MKKIILSLAILICTIWTFCAYAENNNNLENNITTDNETTLDLKVEKDNALLDKITNKTWIISDAFVNNEPISVQQYFELSGKVEFTQDTNDIAQTIYGKDGSVTFIIGDEVITKQDVFKIVGNKIIHEAKEGDDTITFTSTYDEATDQIYTIEKNVYGEFKIVHTNIKLNNFVSKLKGTWKIVAPSIDNKILTADELGKYLNTIYDNPDFNFQDLRFTFSDNKKITCTAVNSKLNETGIYNTINDVSIATTKILNNNINFFYVKKYDILVLVNSNNINNMIANCILTRMQDNTTYRKTEEKDLIGVWNTNFSFSGAFITSPDEAKTIGQRLDIPSLANASDSLIKFMENNKCYIKTPEAIDIINATWKINDQNNIIVTYNNTDYIFFFDIYTGMLYNLTKDIAFDKDTDIFIAYKKANSDYFKEKVLNKQWILTNNFINGVPCNNQELLDHFGLKDKSTDKNKDLDATLIFNDENTSVYDIKGNVHTNKLIITNNVFYQFAENIDDTNIDGNYMIESTYDEKTNEIYSKVVTPNSVVLQIFANASYEDSETDNQVLGEWKYNCYILNETVVSHDDYIQFINNHSSISKENDLKFSDVTLTFGKKGIVNAKNSNNEIYNGTYTIDTKNNFIVLSSELGNSTFKYIPHYDILLMVPTKYQDNQTRGAILKRSINSSQRIYSDDIKGKWVLNYTFDGRNLIDIEKNSNFERYTSSTGVIDQNSICEFLFKNYDLVEYTTYDNVVHLAKWQIIGNNIQILTSDNKIIDTFEYNKDTDEIYKTVISNNKNKTNIFVSFRKEIEE